MYNHFCYVKDYNPFALASGVAMMDSLSSLVPCKAKAGVTLIRNRGPCDSTAMNAVLLKLDGRLLARMRAGPGDWKWIDGDVFGLGPGERRDPKEPSGMYRLSPITGEIDASMRDAVLAAASDHHNSKKLVDRLLASRRSSARTRPTNAQAPKQGPSMFSRITRFLSPK